MQLPPVKGPLNPDCKTEIALPLRPIKPQPSAAQLQRLLVPPSRSVCPLGTIPPRAVPGLTQDSTQHRDCSAAFH